MLIDPAVDALFETFSAGVSTDELGPVTEATLDFLDRRLGEGPALVVASVFELHAVELALVIHAATGTSPLEGAEIAVTERIYRTALSKVGCPLLVCAFRYLDRPSILDVIPFPGDARKAFARYRSYDVDEPADLGLLMPTFMADVARAVSRQQPNLVADDPFAEVEFADTVAVQGGLWAVKAAVLRSAQLEPLDRDALSSLAAASAAAYLRRV